MNDSTTTPLFKLSTGGLLHTLLIRIHVIDEDKYHTQRLIYLFIGITWIPLLILSALDGFLYKAGAGLSFITDINPHVRFLITVPILLLANQLVDPLLNNLVQHLKTSGLIADKNQSRYGMALDKLTQSRDSKWADIVIIVIAFLISLLAKPGFGETELEKYSIWLWKAKGDSLSISYAGAWYFLFAAPLSQIVLYRWVWRFIIWTIFLFRVSRIKLALLPTHGDLVGGASILSISQTAFVIVFVAFGTMLSSGLAHEMLVDGSSLQEIRPIIYSFIACSLIAIVAPLLFFTRQLLYARRRGRRQYGALGYRLSNAFDQKWNLEAAPMEQGKDISTAVDPSALADYNAVLETINDMRIFPMKLRTIVTLGVVLCVPYAPLILIEIPFKEALTRIFNILV